MSLNTLVVERPKPGLAILTLNRPDARNALSLQLRGALVQTMRDLESSGVCVAILTGAGSSFCAGLDLKELSADANALASIATDNPIAAIRAFSGVVIGAINGTAATGGFELALACDILIASDAARFADTHARVGVMPGWELSQRLSRTIGLYRAKYMSLTGNYISAAQAQAWGIVSEVVPAEKLLCAARAIADQALSSPPESLRALKKLIDDGYSVSLQEAIAIEARRSADFNSKVTPESVAARRSEVQRLGKQ